MYAAQKKVLCSRNSAADYVGDKFAEEARKIHYEETEKRGIYGEASLDEARELLEEGVSVLPIPSLPTTTIDRPGCQALDLRSVCSWPENRNRTAYAPASAKCR